MTPFPLSFICSTQSSGLFSPSTPVTVCSYEVFSSPGARVTPALVQLCMQPLLSVSIWMSNTHPNSTHVKPPLQLRSRICLLPSVPSQIRAVHSNSFLPVAQPPDLGSLCDSPLPLLPHSFSLPCHYAQRLLILPCERIRNPTHSPHLHRRP